MTINELIAELEAVRAEHGDIEVSIDNQERCLGEDDMLWIEPILRYWRYEEDRWGRRGRKHRAYTKTGTPILIL